MTDLRTPPVSDGDLFRERIRQFAVEKPLQQLHVLVAGCGWGPELDDLDLGPVDLFITGVDADTPALRARTERRSDLASWHLGDLRTVPLPPRAYHVVWAHYLVERLPHAELVLDRIVAALKPGGLLLIRLRDRETARGLVDRLTPMALRHWLQDGRDHMPPAAIYEPVASYRGLQWYCGMRGLRIAEEFTTLTTAPNRTRWDQVAGTLAHTLAALSGGRLPADHSEISLVIRKPENRFARVI